MNDFIKLSLVAMCVLLISFATHFVDIQFGSGSTSQARALSQPLTREFDPTTLGFPRYMGKVELAAHYIYNNNDGQHKACSATAIGPRALLTATHCLLNSRNALIDGQLISIDGTKQPSPFNIINDGEDHSIIIYDHVVFSTYIHARALALTGEDVYSFGAPGAQRILFHKGYVAGYSIKRDTGIPVILINIPTWFGDSGSAVFDRQGNIVAVISMVFAKTSKDDNTSYGVAFPMHFTDAQWNSAIK